MPASRSESAAACAAAEEVVITPILIFSSRTIFLRSLTSPTVSELVVRPIFFGSLSTIATTGKPRDKKPSNLASAQPKFPAPTTTTFHSRIKPSSRLIW